MHSLYFASQIEAELYLVDQQIFRHTRTDMSRTQEGELQLQKLRRIRQALSAPVYKLTGDVLAEIFKFVALQDGRAHAASSLILSHVVGRWRYAALHIPILWTSLFIHLPSTDAEVSRSQELSSRSGLLPVSCTMRAASEGHYLRLSSSIVTRMESLHLFGEDDFSFSGLVLRALRLPSASLSISELSIDRVMFDTPDAFFDLISSCPRLKHLQLIRMYFTNLELARATGVVQLLALESFSVEDWAANSPILEPVIGIVQLYTPHLHCLGIEADWMVRPLFNPMFSAVKTFSLRVVGRVRSEIVVQTICGLPSLRVLKLAVQLQDERRKPSFGRFMPSIASIDFTSSKRIDRLACALVNTLTLPGGPMSLNLVRCSAVHAPTRAWRWIRQHVPELQII